MIGVYARKATRPAAAARKREPETADAEPVNWDGVAVADGAVALCAYEMVPVEEAIAEVTGATVVGTTVMVEYITVGTQVARGRLEKLEGSIRVTYRW